LPHHEENASYLDCCQPIGAISYLEIIGDGIRLSRLTFVLLLRAFSLLITAIVVFASVMQLRHPS
jgi:hypothetical protein